MTNPHATDTTTGAAPDVDQVDQIGHDGYDPTMTLSSAIPTKAFSQAKAELSALMDQVVREHRPAIIERRREAMVALSLSDMRSLLETFGFEPRVTFGRKEVVASLDDLGLVGAGTDLGAAIDDLLEELRDYVTDFIRRYAFYVQTDRRAHAPWVLRFALTAPEEQRQLLLQDPAEVSAT